MEVKGIVTIGLEHIHPHPDNPRKDLGDLTELAESIKKNGIRQNLTVIPKEGEPGEYITIIGHRRSAAAKLAGVTEAPCRVVEGMTDNWYFTGEQRTGCCVCGFGCHLEPVPNRLQRLRTSDNDKHRRMCEGCLQIKNHGMTYEQALNYAGIPTEEVQEDE